MKLFLWEMPYPVPYGASLCFAVAEDVESARRIALNTVGTAARGTDYSDFRAGLGEPTRVLDLPCAEWHEWSE